MKTDAREREDTELAGFRPSKRYKPDAPRRERIDEIRFAIGNSSIGLVLVAQGAEGLSAVLLGDDREELRTELANRFPGATLTDGDATLNALVAKVVAFVEAPARGLTVFLDMRGSEFQQSVWRALLEIPAGKTTTYREVANRIGRPSAVRAVAAACAANHLAVVVPCHRVVRTDGQLAGYRWGIERKRALLEREAEA